MQGPLSETCIHVFNRFGETAAIECEATPNRLPQIIKKYELKECIQSCTPSDFTCQDRCLEKSRKGTLREGYSKLEPSGCGMTGILLLVVLLLVFVFLFVDRSK